MFPAGFSDEDIVVIVVVGGGLVYGLETVGLLVELSGGVDSVVTVDVELLR